jgi:uncharacterized membrane protein YgcG
MPGTNPYQYGGPGGPRGFGFTWYGDVLLNQFTKAQQQAARQVAFKGLTYMRSIVRVKTGALRKSTYSRIRTTYRGNVAIDIGAIANHAIYNELGTSRWEGSPFIRPTIDYVTPMLAAIIQQAVNNNVRGGGQPGSGSQGGGTGAPGGASSGGGGVGGGHTP